MAATLTDELTRVSVADIEKWDEGPDGTVYVYGRCTTPDVDTDDQVVASEWSGPALKEYLATAPTVRVQHNPQRDPAGSAVRVDVNRDGDGAHWLKAAVDEPIAQRLVKRGHLRAFSVGIARPVIERDISGKARGGIIKGGKIVEVSLVDSPANRSCFLEIAKSAADGTCEFTGKIGGSDDFLAKALDGDLLTKAAPADGDLVNVDLPPGASISISPLDFAKLHTLKQQLVTKTAAAEKRDVATAERRSLADEGNALPDGSYPIKNTGDLHNAAHLARTGHGDVAAARRLIARRAGELGVANPLDESDDANKSASEAAVLNAAVQTVMLAEDAVKEAGPDVTKDPEDDDAPAAKKAKKPKGKKKMPPWLKPDDDGDSDSDGDACKGAHAWTLTGSGDVPDIVCGKCHTTPAEAAGLAASHDMSAAPVGELLESPPVASMKSGTPQSASGADEAETMDPAPEGELADTPPPASVKDTTQAGMMKASPEVAAILRFKRAGIDIELGRLHDLTCPAFSPEDVSKCHPFADLARTDEGYFQRKAVAAACGPDLAFAKSVQLAWQAARVLRETDPGQLNDFRVQAHKAFRDANPGPASAPTPGMMAPGKYNRPLITDGHEASSTGHDGPNSSPAVATSSPDAHNFDRPPLASGHQSPSPSHMKAGFPYPGAGEGPVRLNYAVMEKERARQALMQMHEHLSRQFPEACPIDLDRPAMQPESRGVPAAVGKDAEPSLAKKLAEGIHNGDISIDDARKALGLEPLGLPETSVRVAASKGTLDEAAFFADADVYKGFKKMRKKLGKKVLSGKMTVDEARTRMGRQFAQKAAEPDVQAPDGYMPAPDAADQIAATTGLSPSEAKSLLSAVLKAAAPAPVPLEPATIDAGHFGMDPEVIKAAVTDATTELKELLVKQQETFTAKLAEQQKVIDAIADQPDPGTAAFSGLAFNPLHTKSRRPAGVPEQAEIAERTQLMVMRELQNKYNASSDPAEREAYYGTLAKMRGYSGQ